MEENAIDLKRYFALFKRWAWLLILDLVLGGTVGYGASRLQTPVYQAATKVMVTRGGMADQSMDTYSFLYTDQLTQTYLVWFIKDEGHWHINSLEKAP